MEKPKRYIHLADTPAHPEAGVLVIGRVILPLVSLFHIYLAVVVGLFIWGIVGSSMVGWMDGWSFIPFLISLGVALALVVLFVLSIFVFTIWETIRDANKKGLG